MNRGGMKDQFNFSLGFPEKYHILGIWGEKEEYRTGREKRGDI